MNLSQSELHRYARQMNLKAIGVKGQERLKQASVFIVGVGGLGSPAALYLAAAGIGRIGIIDLDAIDASNLQRQILYSSKQVGQPKAQSAAERLRDLNPHVQIESFAERLSAENALTILRNYDFIVDGADNFATRFLVNDAAFLLRKTLITASVLEFEGQLCVFEQGGPCFRCLYPEPPPSGSVPSCAEAGVLGVLPGLFGVLQANEVLKRVLNLPGQMKSEMLIADLLSLQFTKLELAKNSECPLCGPSPSIRELKEENFICRLDAEIPEIEAEELAALAGKIQLLDVREAAEFAEGRLDFTHHIPIGELETQFAKLSQETPVVVYCRSGARSLKACRLLRQKGFHAINLRGGIQSVGRG